MIYIIWEFIVDPSQIAAFERIYGLHSDWIILFQKSKEYHGTKLLKDCSVPGRYITVDKWDNLDAFEKFKAKYSNEYQDIDIACEKITISEQKIGVFKEHDPQLGCWLY